MTKRNGAAVAVITILFWLVLALLVLSFLGCTSSLQRKETPCVCDCTASCGEQVEGGIERETKGGPK